MAHYDCSCCGEAMGISHDYCSSCKAGKCHKGVSMLSGDMEVSEKEKIVHISSYASEEDINKTYEQLEKALQALEKIKTFGYSHSGYGYSCAKMADEALKDVNNG